MSEEEIIKEFKELIYNPDYDEILLCTEDGFTEWHELFKNVLDLYNKEKEKNIAIEIYRKDMPKDTKLIIMRKEDFDRNFSNEYIHKDKIRELKDKFIKDSKNEKVFMTQSSQINASLIQFCNELLEERN